MLRQIRSRLAAAVVIAAAIACTGCAGMTWDEMKAEGNRLLSRGEAVNRELAAEAEEVNSRVVSGSYYGIHRNKRGGKRRHLCGG